MVPTSCSLNFLQTMIKKIRTKQQCTFNGGCNFIGYLYSGRLCGYHYKKAMYQRMNDRKKKRESNDKDKLNGRYARLYESWLAIGDEKALFLLIWKQFPHKSYLSGEDLEKYFGTDFFWDCFIHVLPKRLNAFPQFRLNPDNIILGTPQEHQSIDQGTADGREKMIDCDWKGFEQKYNKLLKQYDKMFA